MASGIKLKSLPAVIVSSAGSLKPLSASHLLVYSAAVQSLSTNSGTQYFGDKDMDDGIEFKPGDVIEIEPPDRARGTDQFDLADVYVDSSSNGAEFRVVVWIRE